MTKETKVLRTIGKCIYCGTLNTPLSDEHIVPLGLGGEWLLREASCLNCQGITSAFERTVLRDTLLPIRTKMDLPTRRKNKRPDQFTIIAEKDGETREVNIPSQKYPAILCLPRFKLPAYIDKRGYKSGIVLDGMYYKVLMTQSWQEIGQELGADSVTITTTFKGKGGFHFARLLAKIAHGFAVASYGLNVIDSSYLLPSILGKVDDVGMWVGRSDISIPTYQKLHEIVLRVEKSTIYCYIRLFGMFTGSPEYLAIVGLAKQP